MKKFGIKYHPKVKEDIKRLDKEIKERIKQTIEEKLAKAPELYGERLKGTLKDFWKLKVGKYRVMYIVNANKNIVFILGIWHRKEAYKRSSMENLLKRLKS